MNSYEISPLSYVMDYGGLSSLSKPQIKPELVFPNQKYDTIGGGVYVVLFFSQSVTKPFMWSLSSYWLMCILYCTMTG